MLKKILFFSLALFFLFALFSLSYSKERRKYYDEAFENFSEGQAVNSKERLYEAYGYYDRAQSAALASKEIENLKEAERKEMNKIIRQSRNQKFRLAEITRASDNLMQEGRVSRGMSREHVVRSLGEPSDITKKIYKWEELETWYYGNPINDNEKYIYFKDGVVVDWEDKEKR